LEILILDWSVADTQLQLNNQVKNQLLAWFEYGVVIAYVNCNEAVYMYVKSTVPRVFIYKNIEDHNCIFQLHLFQMDWSEVIFWATFEKLNYWDWSQHTAPCFTLQVFAPIW